MKLSIIGGGGIRGPLLLLTLARRRERYNIEEVLIYDVDGKKTALMAAITRAMLEREDLKLDWRVCATPKEALTGMDAIITTIREGFEEGRARDERICLDLGVIGQETTGPAGFAYAVRSVPSITEYVKIAMDRSPGCWILNFTNPAGLVAQSMQRVGYPKVIGICDSADNAQKFVAKRLGVPRRAAKTHVFGLNHLSWTSSVTVGGRDVLPECLADDAFIKVAQNVFPPELPRGLGLFCNEYLFYFYRTREALASMLAEKESRGELIVRLNREVLSDLASRLAAKDAAGAIARYEAYHQDRSETYMEYARVEGAPSHEFEIEGYAGVALDFLDSLAGEGVRMSLNVANRGAIDFLSDDDNVEVSCDVGGGSFMTVKAPPIPADIKKLIFTVKKYERLAVESIERKSRDAAIAALTVHPLVADEGKAVALIKAFAEAQPKYFAGWK
jgi:6-phospho-beta-glucosidase